MGLELNDSGNVYFENELLQKRDKNFYKSVQIIFQNPQECISHRLNVLDAVTEPLKVQGFGSKKERTEKAKKVLNDVELPSDDKFLKKYAYNLSGGEIQRAAIARALILEPRLLICDEPTSALDASIQAKITKLLLNLQEKKGLSLIFITHDLALARKISDKVIVMLAGEIIESGPTYEVFTNPKHPYTRDLLDVAPDFTFKIPELKKVINKKMGACPYHIRCSKAQELCLLKEPEVYVEGLRKVKCHLYGSYFRTDMKR
jgi:peptide/nickel transport system ATP-binding protein